MDSAATPIEARANCQADHGARLAIIHDEEDYLEIRQAGQDK